MKYIKEYNSYNFDKSNQIEGPKINIRGKWFSIKDICSKYPENNYETEIYNHTQEFLEQFHEDMNKAFSILSDYDSPRSELYDWYKQYPQPKESANYDEYENENIFLNLSPYLREYTELCSLKEIEKFREFKRDEEWSRLNIAKIKKDIAENGIKEPMILEYSSIDKKAILTEGNHRLDIARQLYLDYYPVRVITNKNSFTGEQAIKAVKVSGIEPNEHGYVPSMLKPSQIGIKDTRPITGKLYK
jgi:ParB-like nuclease domain